MDLKSKAVFIDGANLFAMLRANNIWLNYANFKKELESIGELPMASEYPFIVVSQRTFDKNETYLERSGYKYVISETYNGQDDAVIIRQLQEVDPDQIGEIVLVSCDGGFYSELERLHGLGVAIHIVGTQSRDKNGNHMMPMLGRRSGLDFRFHWIEEFKDKIHMTTEIVVKKHIRMTLEFDLTIPQQEALMNELAGWMSRFEFNIKELKHI